MSFDLCMGVVKLEVVVYGIISYNKLNEAAWRRGETPNPKRS